MQHAARVAVGEAAQQLVEEQSRVSVLQASAVPLHVLGQVCVLETKQSSVTVNSNTLALFPKHTLSETSSIGDSIYKYALIIIKTILFSILLLGRVKKIMSYIYYKTGQIVL